MHLYTLWSIGRIKDFHIIGLLTLYDTYSDSDFLKPTNNEWADEDKIFFIIYWSKFKTNRFRRYFCLCILNYNDCKYFCCIKIRDRSLLWIKISKCKKNNKRNQHKTNLIRIYRFQVKKHSVLQIFNSMKSILISKSKSLLMKTRSKILQLRTPQRQKINFTQFKNLMKLK